MKIYRSDSKNAIAFGAALAIWVISAWSIAENTQVFINSSVAVTIILGIVALLVTLLSYIAVWDTTLRFVYLFFYRRTIDVFSITEINDQPTYKVAKGAFRSLYVFYKDAGATKWVELHVSIFSEKTLGFLIMDLKKINSKIVLNKYAQHLMDSASANE